MARRRADGVRKGILPKRQVQYPIISSLKRHEVQTLRRAGLTRAKVVELTGVSRRSVQRIEEEAPIAGAPRDGHRHRRPVRVDRGARRGQAEPMLSLLKRHEVGVLRRAGLSRTKVQAEVLALALHVTHLSPVVKPLPGRGGRRSAGARRAGQRLLACAPPT